MLKTQLIIYYLLLNLLANVTYDMNSSLVTTDVVYDTINRDKIFPSINELPHSEGIKKYCDYYVEKYLEKP